MEYAEEILKRADFSAETDFKERLREMMGLERPAYVRDITLEELAEKNGVELNPVHKSRRKEVPQKAAELKLAAGKTDPEADAEPPVLYIPEVMERKNPRVLKAPGGKSM